MFTLTDVDGYITTIIEDKNRYRTTDRPTRKMTMMDLDARALKHLQYTLAARLNALRNNAGQSVHEMNQKAMVPCKPSRAQCRTSRQSVASAATISTPQPARIIVT